MNDLTKEPYDIIKILTDNEYEKALKFINLGSELNCRAKTRYAHCNKYWRCVFSKTKPSRVLFTVECTEEWWRIKAMLSNIQQYKAKLNSCSDALINSIKAAYDCHKCNDYCKGANPFILDGIEYRKCIGCSFYFSGLSDIDQEGLISLLKEEAKI